MFARTHTAGIISGSTNNSQKSKFFSNKNLTNKVFKAISERPFPLKKISMIFENSAALSLFNKLIKS